MKEMHVIRYKYGSGNHMNAMIHKEEVWAENEYDAMQQIIEKEGKCYIVSVHDQFGKKLFDNASNYPVSGPG